MADFKLMGLCAHYFDKCLLIPTQHNHRILYYHAVSDRQLEYYPLQKPFTPDALEKQIKWLISLGFRFIPLSEAVQAINTGSKLTKTVSLTFDDNFSCLFESVLPLIQKYKLSPTLFITTKTLDNQAFAWNHKFLLMNSIAKPDTLNEAIKQNIKVFGGNTTAAQSISAIIQSVDMSQKDNLADAVWDAVMPFSQAEYLDTNKPFLSNEQIMQMVSEGCEIGSHSHSHPDFSKLNYEQSLNELNLSWLELKQFPLPLVRLFAYPYGKRCSADIEANLATELEIDCMAGTLFSMADNINKGHKWEREIMELGSKKEHFDFVAKPILRYLKKNYSR